MVAEEALQGKLCPLLANEGVFERPRPTALKNEAALDRQVILVAGTATSGADSTCVANLETVPEVDKTNFI